MFKILEDDYEINNLHLTKSELLKLRPNAAVLPEGIIRCEYDGEKALYSTGKKQKNGGVWKEADILLSDRKLEEDLKALRDIKPPITHKEARDNEMAEMEFKLPTYAEAIIAAQDTEARDRMVAAHPEIDVLYEAKKALRASKP